MFNARGQVLCLDLPDQWLGGVEHEDQWLLVALQRLDGFQMQLNLVRQKKEKKRGVKKYKRTTGWRKTRAVKALHGYTVSKLCFSHVH